MDRDETLRVEKYLKAKLNPNLRLVSRGKTDDSVEVFLEEEFIALLYKDVDEGETAYQFQMTVLEEDLAPS